MIFNCQTVILLLFSSGGFGFSYQVQLHKMYKDLFTVCIFKVNRCQAYTKGGGGVLLLGPDRRSSRFEGLTKWLPNGQVLIITQWFS